MDGLFQSRCPEVTSGFQHIVTGLFGLLLGQLNTLRYRFQLSVQGLYYCGRP
ncbi:hypothetical protein SAMN05216255_0190 [Pseudomonas segetis]|uniref:Uncharacterized protein n=1 Tax=Pseudomonas segetis TaxID=298908 RepID=A0A238Z6X2_9PSED|nr:hypothetical protein SAMN05216255_0190 [Pseudomonas segetis]